VRSRSTQKLVYLQNTYRAWRNGDSTRIEDENLLAACSGPFLTNHPRLAQFSIFLNLPLELQHEVFRNVDRNDLKALSQTCVVLRALIIPFIMERVILCGNSPRLDLVVQTLEATMSNSKEAAGLVRRIDLPNDDTVSDILARLLPLTTKLSSLAYGYTVAEYSGGPDMIDAPRISRLLTPVQHSLTHLSITYRLCLNQCDCGGDPCVLGWCSLEHMDALKSLQITFSILLGSSATKAPKLAHILPPGIVKLWLESDPWEIDPSNWNHEQRFGVLAEFVRNRNWEQFTPRLKVLHYNMEFLLEYWPNETADTEMRLEEMMHENGLECYGGPPIDPPISCYDDFYGEQ